MTKKDYIAIAEIFKSHQVDASHCKSCDQKATTLSLLAYDFAEMFERDNPRFKRDRFYTAAGFAQKGN